MKQSDEILVMTFDDQSPPLTMGTRSTQDRPTRADAGRNMSADPIALVILNSPAQSQEGSSRGTENRRLQLGMDFGFLDPRTGSFVMVFSAETIRDRMQARTVVIPMTDSDQPIMSLSLYRRQHSGAVPVLVQVFRWDQDIRGQCLTLRFRQEQDLESWEMATSKGTIASPATPAA